MIEFDGLRKFLNGEWVLRGVDLEIHPGETVTLMGPSGTGKSVLLKHVVGLMDPDGGDVRVDGISVPSAGPREIARVRSKVSYVFQDSALFDSLTVAENIRMGITGEPNGDSPDADLAVRRSLERVNLGAEVLDRLPSELSGGMKKRVALARALVGEREYILYDEPTTGLDPVNASLIRELIVRCHEQQACPTDVIVTHDVELGFSLADRVVFLDEGEVRAEGTPEEIRTSSDGMVRAFLRGSGERRPAEAHA